MSKRSSVSNSIKNTNPAPKSAGKSNTLMSTSQKTLAGVVAVVVLASLSAAFYFHSQFNQLKADPQKAVQAESKDLIARVGNLIVLPEGEEPTIATVTDTELLKSQPFFANAKKGDKVLIYTNARKAILYSPESDKIVEVAPVNIGAPQAQPTKSEPSKPAQEQPKAQ